MGVVVLMLPVQVLLGFVWEVDFLKHVKGTLFTRLYLLRVVRFLLENDTEVFGEEDFHEGEFQLEDSLDELVIGRVEVVEEPDMVALEFCSHAQLVLALLHSTGAVVCWEIHREAVLLVQRHFQTFFGLLNRQPRGLWH